MFLVHRLNALLRVVLVDLAERYASEQGPSEEPEIGRQPASSGRPKSASGARAYPYPAAPLRPSFVDDRYCTRLFVRSGSDQRRCARRRSRPRVQLIFRRLVRAPVEPGVLALSGDARVEVPSGVLLGVLSETHCSHPRDASGRFEPRPGDIPARSLRAGGCSPGSDPDLMESTPRKLH